LIALRDRACAEQPALQVLTDARSLTLGLLGLPWLSPFAHQELAG